jgi:hypothetical protein
MLFLARKIKGTTVVPPLEVVTVTGPVSVKVALKLGPSTGKTIHIRTRTDYSKAYQHSSKM